MHIIRQLLPQLSTLQHIDIIRNRNTADSVYSLRSDNIRTNVLSSNVVYIDIRFL